MNQASSTRIPAIDATRGLVMVLMALDHTRDYFGNFAVDPVNLQTTTPALFFTRWITHFCAPVFVLLAGLGAALYGRRAGVSAMSRFLWTRGLWLIVLEFTVVTFAWNHTLTPIVFFVQVIAAIGAAMVLMAALVYLPRPWVAAIGALLVAGHNATDSWSSADFGANGWWWALLQEGSMGPGGGPFTPWDGAPLVMVIYPVLPWLGVMALGYGASAVCELPPPRRRRTFALLGLGAIAAFVALRLSTDYGDPVPFAAREDALGTVMAFINCQKYPPSLAYVLMTLGPSLLVLAAFDRPVGRVLGWLTTFGRVPLFYYVFHLLLIHTAARVMYWAMHGEPYSAIQQGLTLLFSGQPLPEWYGKPLWVVYAAWIAAVVALYPLCRWYADYKRRHRSVWLSYL